MSPYTGFLGELEHLKTKMRLIDEMVASVMGEVCATPVSFLFSYQCFFFLENGAKCNSLKNTFVDRR